MVAEQINLCLPRVTLVHVQRARLVYGNWEVIMLNIVGGNLQQLWEKNIIRLDGDKKHPIRL